MPIQLSKPTFQSYIRRGIVILGVLCAVLLVVVGIRPTVADDVPTLAFSTFFGGDNTEFSADIAVDGDGNIYIAGDTASADFPITTVIDEGDPTSYMSTLFVSKFDPTGTTLLYSTVLGSGQMEGLAVDEDGSAYVIGEGASLPMVGAIQPMLGGFQDAFVAKLNPTGTALEFSTYLGGSGDEFALGISLDAARNVYVIGATTSADFPTQNAYDDSLSSAGRQDVFVTKINASGSALVYSTYYGGNEDDIGFDIVADDDGNTYLTGRTDSADFPVVSAYQAVAPGRCPVPSGCSNAFVAKLNTSGMPIFSTYLGGNGRLETGLGIAIDSQHSIYVTGFTNSTDFPLRNAYQTTLMTESTAFLTKFNPSGSQLVYSTYLGGTDDSLGTDVAVDNTGLATITGITVATDFPTVNPIQAQRAGVGRLSDLFISKFSADGRGLQFSTYLGGSQNENVFIGSPRITLDGNKLLVVGMTKSNDFPIFHAYQNQRGGSIVNPNNATDDAFVTKIALYPQSEPTQASTRNFFATHTPTLTWTPIIWATHYHVQVSKNKLFTGILNFESQTAANVFSVTTTPLDDGLYYWRVQAQKPDGTWGEWSSVESFTVDSDG
ncbi:MAG: SBBP repeat-containing protein [Chloroflexota bacterium]